MKIFHSLDNFKSNSKTIVTIGTFDGVHIGHRYIINYLNKIAKREQGESVLLTFSPHPSFVINREHSHLKLIDTLDEKKEKLEKLGLQNIVVQKFTKEFSRTKYVNFVRDILVKGESNHNIFSGSNKPLNQDYFKTLWSRFKKQSNTLEQGQTLYSLDTQEL